jgi:hypothetical protein
MTEDLDYLKNMVIGAFLVGYMVVAGIMVFTVAGKMITRLIKK